jgi:steroid 5-alpha reductase family enzyme
MARRSDFLPVVTSYVLCAAAGAAVLLGGELPEPWDALSADVLATLVVFAFSFRYRNSSFYDPYWSVIPPLLAVWWMWRHPASLDDTRAWLVQGLVWLWAIRLTTNWSVYWGGLQHEDWRYPIVRARAGKYAVLADLGGIHLVPTLQVFLGCLPIYAVMSRPGAPLGVLDGLAFLVTLGAVAIELVADLQLHAFIARRQPGTMIMSGLWGWSRHPNYFGELSFWWGLMLFGLAAAPGQWAWIIPGALAMTWLFVFISVPFMDRRSLERRPAYAEYMRKVSALVPLPPRR